MLASHDSTTMTHGTSVLPCGMARWAARLGGGLLASVGVVALLAKVTFLRALGFGLPGLLAGAIMLALSERVGRRDRKASVACSAIWLLHGVWVVARVTESGGEPSVGIWAVRLLLAAVIVAPAFIVRREEGGEHIRG